MKLKQSLLALALAGSCTVANAESVNIGAPNWTGAQAIANLIKIVVTDKIGGEAELVPGSNATIYQGMDKGDGGIEVHPDVWLPNQANFTDEYVGEKGSVVLSKNPYVGSQHFCVSKDFSEANNVTSIFDLARPEIAKLMDSDGDGKGEIWIGAPGWASANVNEVKVRDYGLLDFMEPVRAEQSVMVATVGDSIQKKRGYAFYCYQPHSIWYQYDVVALEEPAHDPALYNMVQPKTDADWYEKSKVASADAPKAIQIAYAKSLETSAPAIASLLANIKLDTDTVSGWAYEISGKQRDAADVLQEWVDANPERVDSWLGL